MQNPENKRAPQPVLQGGIDRLCGMYSIMNAILLVDPDSRPQLQRHFDVGLEYLISRKKLDGVMLHGMSTKLWVKLALRVLAEHNRLSEEQLELHKVYPNGREGKLITWCNAIECTANEWPVLAHIEGAYDHFTVISCITPKQVVLFDSDGLHWLQRRSCKIGGPDASKRFWIKPNGIFALRPIANSETEI